MKYEMSLGTRVASCAGLLLIATCTGLLAAPRPAPIPIDGPIVISESGAYVVTQDFTATGESAIRLVGDIDVSIDFAGHVVGATDAPVIMVRDWNSRGCPSVALEKGRIAGPGYGRGGGGVYSWTSHGHCIVNVRIEKMLLENANVWVEDGSLSVTSSRFVNSDMFSDANFMIARARFDNNHVTNGNIIAFGVADASIRHNVINKGSIVSRASDGFSSTDNVIEHNTLIDGDIVAGANNSGGDVDRIQIRRNAVSGSIYLNDGEQPIIEENLVRGCGTTGSGIALMGVTRLGLIERNVVLGNCDYSLRFEDLTRGNEYRDNVFKHYAIAPVLDDGIDNVDGGGNIE